MQLVIFFIFQYNEIYNEVPGEEKVDKLVLDFDPETKKELVSVDPNLVAKLKPHQVSERGVAKVNDFIFIFVIKSFKPISFFLLC